MSPTNGDADPAGANHASAPQNQTEPGHNAALGLNPFGDTRSQRVLLTKAIAGESLRNVNKKRGVQPGARGANPDDVVTKDFAQMGLVQQHEQVMNPEYIGARAYKNKRMRLGEIMDSVYVNFAIVCIVFVDVFSIMVYELQVPEEKDCFGRDFPEQEIITLTCLSGYIVELLLRGFGKGFRQSYSLERKNANNIFDASIILVSVGMGFYQSWNDRTQQLSCPDSWEVCEIPPRPYTLDMDKFQDPQLCDLISGTQNEITTARTATTAIRTIRLVLRIIRAVRMLIKARRIGAQITKVIRARVSKHSRRYQKLGFDLDLSYITTRICCMASPAVNRLYTLAVDGERVGVNDAYMMARFLATRHYNNFRIFNFCAEEIGNYAIERLFGQVRRMPVKEKHPPTLADVLLFCENSAHYLFTDEKNVLMLHCDSGKDRSGVFAASFLLYSGHSSSAKDAIDTFTLRRTGQASGDSKSRHVLKTPSLTRVVTYVEAVINSRQTFAPLEAVLTGLEIVAAKRVKAIKVICGGVVLLNSTDKDSVVKLSSSGASFPPTMIQGDTRIAMYADKDSTDSVPDMCIHFHTAFVRDRKIATFVKKDIDFVAVSENSFQDDISIDLIFSSEATSALRMLHAFRSAVETNGHVKHYRKGDVIVERGELLPAIRLVIEGHISEVVPKKTVFQEEGEGMTRGSEVSTIAIYGPGQLFASFALCIGFPDCRCICTSRASTVVELDLEQLLVMDDDPLDSTASDLPNPKLDPESRWHFPGVSADELPGLLKVLCQQLAERALSKEQVARVSSKETIFDADLDAMMEGVRTTAVALFKLPAHEECLHVHRCEVVDGGGSYVADRVILMTDHMILDRKMRGDAIDADTDKGLFHVDELSNMFIAHPDVTVVSFTIRNIQFEARCGSTAHATDFFTRLKRIKDAKHVLFRRLARENDEKGDKYMNTEPAMTPFLDQVPATMHSVNEVIIEAGSLEKGIVYILSGTLMLMDGVRVVKVLRAGEYAGISEYMLNIRTQRRLQVRSEDGCMVIRLPRPLLKARLESHPELAAGFFRCMAKLLASQIYVMVVKDWPTAAFATKRAMDAPPGYEYDDGGDHDEDADGDGEVGERGPKAQRTFTAVNPDIVKLLKLRKTAFMKHLDEAGIDIIARGLSVRKLTAGSVLIREGEKVANSPVDCMYLIIEGKLEVYINGLDEDHLLKTIGRGEIVGERALFLQEDRSATIKARHAVTVGAINISFVRQLVELQPWLINALKQIYKNGALHGLSTGGRNPSAVSGNNSAAHGASGRGTQQHKGLKEAAQAVAAAQAIAHLPSGAWQRPIVRISEPASNSEDAPAHPAKYFGEEEAVGRSSTRGHSEPQENGAGSEMGGSGSHKSSSSNARALPADHRLVELTQLGELLGIARPGVPTPVGNHPSFEGGFLQSGNGLGEHGNHYHGLNYYHAITTTDAEVSAQNGQSRLWSPNPASLHSFEEGESMG